jgi:CyaY protein
MSLPPGAPKNTTPSLLSEAEYDARTDALLGAIEATCDRWLQDDLIDIDTRRTGGLLEMHFPNGSKMVVNTQPPLHELWLAARDGGFHYRWDGSAWRDTRDGSEFVATLSRLASAQAGRALSFAAISA